MIRFVITAALLAAALGMVMVGAGGVFRTSRPTPHTRTCAEVIRRFTGQAVEIKQDSGSWLIRVNGRREE